MGDAASLSTCLYITDKVPFDSGWFLVNLPFFDILADFLGPNFLNSLKDTEVDAVSITDIYFCIFQSIKKVGPF